MREDLFKKAKKAFALGPKDLLARKAVTSALIALSLFSSPAIASDAPEKSQPSQIVLKNAPIAPSVFFNPWQEHDAAKEFVLPNGLIDSATLIGRWWDAEMDIETVMELQSVLVLTQSPVITTSAPAEKAARELSEKTKAIFNVKTPAEAAIFLKDNGLTALLHLGLLSQASVLTNSKILETNGFEVFSDAFLRHKRYASENIRARPEDLGKDVKEAQKNLERLAGDLGLRTLRVPLPYWTDKEALTKVAKEMTEEAKNITRLTGLPAQSFGLYGRVDLTVGAPFDDIQGFAEMSGGSVSIQSHMKDYAHEWYHGFVAATALLEGEIPKESPLVFLVRYPQKDVRLAQKDILNTTSVGSFLTRMDDFAEKAIRSGNKNPMDTEYYKSTHEQMAYLFEASVQALIPVSEKTEIERDQVVYSPRPTKDEALSIVSIWQNLFQKVSTGEPLHETQVPFLSANTLKKSKTADVPPQQTRPQQKMKFL